MLPKFRKSSIAHLMVLVAITMLIALTPGCAFLKKMVGADTTEGGKVDPLKVVVTSYCNIVPLSSGNTRALLKELIASGKITDAAKVEANFNLAAKTLLQAGEDLKNYIKDPTSALLSNIIRGINQGTELLVGIIPGAQIVNDSLKLKAKPGPLRGGRVIIAPYSVKNERFKTLDRLGFVVTPVMVELALTALISLAEFLVQQFGTPPSLPDETKTLYIGMISEAQAKIPTW